MISNIRLQNFRSYLDESFEFEPGVNIIVGANASGKTNLLEGISVVCAGKSFKAKESETIMFDKPWARLDGYVSKSDRAIKIIGGENRVVKEYVVDERPYKRLRKDLLVPVVIFEPNHLFLLIGPPDARRDFIDNIIEHTNAGYERLLKDYKKTLSQRNSLLKSGIVDSDQMFVWNLRLCEQGQAVAQARMLLIDDMNILLPGIYSGLAGKKHDITLEYKSKSGTDNYASTMMRSLEKNEELDHRRGFTSHGPHRDDIDIYIEGNLSSISASRGETRTMLLALKMYELKTIEKAQSKKPVLLLDDVFSELDGSRRKALTSYLNKYQSFITTTDADILSHKLIEDSKVILF